MAVIRRAGQLALLGVLGLATGCTTGAKLPFLGGKSDVSAAATATSTRYVERDVEAPEVFQVSAQGLWDGRPSLGGVWVAHPEAKDPERVIIRNEANGKFVIGALFRRERENPGPSLQVSSDAASALGILAGQPTRLNVTALRREETAEPAPAADEPGDTDEKPAAATVVHPGGGIETSTIAPAPAPVAAVSTPAAPASGTSVVPATTAPRAAQVAPSRPKTKPRPVSSLSRPFIQIGFYSVEANAERTGQALRKAGIVPTIEKQTASGKTFWKVLVGPATSASERDALLGSIRSLGYTDAYFVTD